MFTVHCFKCLLFSIYSLTLTVYCLLFTIYPLLLTSYCLLFTVNCLMVTVNCLLYTVNCLLLTVFCWQSNVYCLMFMKIVSSDPNIMKIFFDQSSPQPPEGGVSRCHTHTNQHCNSMTESAQWANSVKKKIFCLQKSLFC